MTQSVFKWGKASLNLDFFLFVDWLPYEAKEPRLPYFPHNKMKNRRIRIFSKGYHREMTYKRMEFQWCNS